jgi:ABC-type uncharacterized transport system involved in gliding motility auxiliary subunit
MKQLIGVLGWLGIGLVVAAVALRIATPERASLYQNLAIAGLVVTVLYALSQWRDIRRSFGSRNVQYGSIMAGGVVIFLALLVGINWIASRRTIRWDLTTTGEFSLSDQTKQILQGLDKPLTIKVFHGRNDVTQTYRDRLEGYQYHSSQVAIEYINAEGNPTEAEKYEISAVPTLILEYDGRTQRATSADEQAVSNALKKVIEGGAKKAYFTQGHGERDPDDSGRPGYLGAKTALTDENIEVSKVTLAQAGSIPADATLIVVAGASSDFLPQETEMLRNYLNAGGKLLLMIDPPAKGGPQQPTSLIALAKEWGIDVGNDIVVDPNGQLVGFDASVPVGMPMPHAITNNFKLMTAFPMARSVVPTEGGASGKFPQKIVETGNTSWAEADVKALYETMRPEKNTDKGDKAGPVSVVVAVSAPASAPPPPAEGAPADGPKPESRLVVTGDSDFASNQLLGFQGNQPLFLNMMNWLAQQEDLIAIRPKDPEDRRIQLTQGQLTGILWLTMAIIPLLLFGNAVRVYRKKR